MPSSSACRFTRIWGAFFGSVGDAVHDLFLHFGHQLVRGFASVLDPPGSGVCPVAVTSRTRRYPESPANQLVAYASAYHLASFTEIAWPPASAVPSALRWCQS